MRDLSGQRFGRLVVTDRAENHVTARGDKVHRWTYICDCGKSGVAHGQRLTSGKTRSCGCLREESCRQRRADDPRRIYTHDPDGAKACRSCGVVYSATKGNFATRSGRPEYFVSTCNACVSVKQREYRQKNLEKVRRRGRESERARWSKDPDGCRVKARAYRATSGYKKKSNESKVKARRTNPLVAIRHRIGTQLRKALRSTKSNRSAFAILGYSRDDLHQHLERQFTRGMSWVEFLAGRIHIDHIVPLVEFCLGNPTDEDIRRAWALSNLRPCWAGDNTKKGSRREFLL